MKSFLRKTGRIVSNHLLPRRAYPVVMGPLRGAKFILGALAGAGGGAAVYFNGIEAEQTTAMCAELTHGKVFFDIGANVGYYSILAARRVGTEGTVVAFEPVVRNLAFLQRHVDLNEARNVRILPFALSDRNSVTSFSLGQNSAMGHLTGDGANAERIIFVPTVTLDEIAAKLNLSPDVLKIDVEGAEMEVLCGGEKLLRRTRPTIFLSTHSPALRAACLKFLRGISYQVKPLIVGEEDSYEFVARFSENSYN